MDTEYLIDRVGMDALNKALGPVDALRFIARIKRDDIKDYTEWRRTQPWYDTDIEELFADIKANEENPFKSAV